jgi:hypothetical protein
MRWATYVVLFGEENNAYTILAGKAEERGN